MFLFLIGVKLVRPTGTQGQISSNTAAANDYDGKRMRRSIQRRTVDYNASAIQTIKVSFLPCHLCIYSLTVGFIQT